MATGAEGGGQTAPAKNIKIADDGLFRKSLSLGQLDAMQVYDADDNAISIGSLHSDTKTIVGKRKGREEKGRERKHLNPIFFPQTAVF